MLTETERRKVLGKLKALQEDKDEHAKTLEYQKTFQEESSEEYGSELCTIGIEKSESEIFSKISELNDKIDLLTNFLNGHPIPAKETEVKLKIKDTDDIIKGLLKDKLAYEKELADIDFLKSALK